MEDSSNVNDMEARMTNVNLGQLVNELYGKLQTYETDLQIKALAAVQVLLDHPNSKQQHGTVQSSRGSKRDQPQASGLDLTDNAREFFDQKQPIAKIEELAVAVRFVELSTGNDAITRSDIEDVILAARRNFDATHFRRDVNNAKFKGLFNKSRDSGVLTLSHYGQRYVDALPDRESLGQLKKPTGAGRRKSKNKDAKKKPALKA
jgi:hypothetical protein